MVGRLEPHPSWAHVANCLPPGDVRRLLQARTLIGPCRQTRRLEPREIGTSAMRRSGQRACRSEQEALRQSYLLQRFELVGRHEALDFGVLARWLQVLADGNKIDLGRAQVVHDLQ